MATVTWTGAGADNLASTILNWDTGTAPTTGDDVVFDGAFPVTGSKNCTWDRTQAMKTVVVNSGYTGTVTQTSKLDCSNSTGSFTFNATGTWDTNGQSVETKIFDASGTATKTLTLGATVWINYGGVGSLFDISGSNLTFNKGTSEVKFRESQTITSKNGNEFQSVTFYIAGTVITLGSDIYINGTLNNPSNNFYCDFLGAKKVYVKGDLTLTGSNCGFGNGTSTTTIEFSGSANQTWNHNSDASNEIYLVPIIINKSGGTLTVVGLFNLSPTSITYTAGTVDCATNTATFKFMRGVNVNLGTMPCYNVTAHSSTTTLTGNLRVDGTLLITTTLDASNRTVTCAGNVTNNGTFTNTSATTIFNGTSTVAGATTFNNLTINNTKTVHLTSTQTFTVSGAFTTSGTSTLDATIGASRANLNVNGSQSVAGVASTDIDSSGGSIKPIHNIGGTNSNTVQWDTTAPSTLRLLTLLGVG